MRCHVRRTGHDAFYLGGFGEIKPGFHRTHYDGHALQASKFPMFEGLAPIIEDHIIVFLRFSFALRT
jgi:hypothetical protein